MASVAYEFEWGRVKMFHALFEMEVMRLFKDMGSTTSTYGRMKAGIGTQVRGWLRKTKGI